MFNSNGYSLADIAAATGGNRSNDGFGDNGWWIILLFLFTGGRWGGNWGGSGSGNGGSTVREEIAYGFDMNGLENSVRGVQQGLCDGFYAMNTSVLNGFAATQNALCQGFSGVNNAITQTGYQTLDAIHADTIANMQNTTALSTGITGLGTQLASCCCDLKSAIDRGFCDVAYNMATQACDTRRAIADSTRDIIDSNNAGVRSILDFLTQDKIASLTAENQSLKFAASQSAQNAYLVSQLGQKCPIPAYVVPNPYCCNNTGYVYTTGCGGCGTLA